MIWAACVRIGVGQIGAARLEARQVRRRCKRSAAFGASRDLRPTPAAWFILEDPSTWEGRCRKRHDHDRQTLAADRSPQRVMATNRALRASFDVGRGGDGVRQCPWRQWPSTRVRTGTAAFSSRPRILNSPTLTSCHTLRGTRSRSRVKPGIGVCLDVHASWDRTRSASGLCGNWRAGDRPSCRLVTTSRGTRTVLPICAWDGCDPARSAS